MIRLKWIMMWVLALGEKTRLARANENLQQFYQLNQALVIEELGLAMLPSKLIASGTSTQFQSVFLKVEIPPIPKSPCAQECTRNHARAQARARADLHPRVVKDKREVTLG